MSDQSRKEFEDSVIRACEKKDYPYTKTVLNRDVNGDYCQMWVDSAWVVWQEKDGQPSDLEIVQKALIKMDYSMLCDNAGIYLHAADDFYECKEEFIDSESLLTWAKQTLGMEI